MPPADPPPSPTSTPPCLPAGTQGAGPRAVLVHGFTQTRASWDPVAAELAVDHTVVAVDGPGHGAAGEVRADLEAGADLLAATGGRATYVGYSMGGRLALGLALRRPEVVERLVLVSTTAGIDDAGERAERRAADEMLAGRIETEGVEAFLDWWLSQPLFAGLESDAAGVAARRTNTSAGLASSLRLAGTGTMDPPWWERLGRIRAAGIPVLVVAGERDQKFTAAARRLADGIGPAARIHVVAGAGHACHLEAPAAFLSALRPFLAGP